MRQLGVERLDVGDLGNEDVALAHGKTLTVRRVLGAVHAFIVDAQFLARLHVVEGDHLLGADHGELALLVRIEPRQLHVRQHAAGEFHGEKHDVLDILLEVTMPVRGHAHRRFPEQE